jgi:hypothetical protein
VTTGAEKFGGPVVISGTVPGQAWDSDDGVITFNSRQQLQRAGLLLNDGAVYIAFASYGDQLPYHGWMLGYNAATLQPVSVFNSTLSTGLGGIWQAGQGPAADADGNVYVMTGNAPYDAETGDYGDSFLKLNPHAVVSDTLPVVDSFTPFDQADLDVYDLDLGSGGPLLIPGTHLLLGGGKPGKFYLLDQDDMGGYQQGADGMDRVVQSFQATILHNNVAYHIRGTPVFWTSPNGPRFYLWGEGESLKEYDLTIHSPVSATIQTTPVATGTTKLPSFSIQGGFLSISANSSAPGIGIVWASYPVTDAVRSGLQGVLRAYDADNVGHELWNSQQNPARDGVGDFAKFNPPTIANGRVYLATFSNQLLTYGIMAQPVILTQPMSQTVASGQTVILSIVVSGQAPLTYQWYKGTSGDTHDPVGENASNYTTSPLATATSYWVRVSNALGTADSHTATVAVTSAIYLPAIIQK